MRIAGSIFLGLALIAGLFAFKVIGALAGFALDVALVTFWTFLVLAMMALAAGYATERRVAE